MNKYITEDILKRAQEVKPLLSGLYNQGVPVSDREFWDNISYVDINELTKCVEEYQSVAFPELTEDIVAETKATRSFKESDEIAFISMRRLEQVVLAECIENKGKYIDYIINGIKSICARKTWVRLAHDVIFDYSAYNGVQEQIDLYSSSVGWRFATIDACLGEKLPEEVRKLMKDNVKRRLTDVFFDRIDKDPESIKINGVVPLYWIDCYDNWLAVCLGGVVCSGLYYCDDDNKRALLIALYEKLIKQYLHSLPEGFCIEGLSYWGYGFGKFIAASDTIFRSTNGAVDMLNKDGFKEAAMFGFKIRIIDKVYPCIGDCAYGVTPLSHCMEYVGKRAGCNYDEPIIDIFKYDLNIVMGLCNWDNRLTDTLNVETSYSKIRTYFEKRNILVSRTNDEKFGIYIQGGHNHNPHNHNDLGSFIIGAYGETFIADPGIGSYYNKALQNGRYTVDVNSSFAHNVPVICKKLQGPYEFHSVNTNFSSERKEDSYEEIKYYANFTQKSFSDISDSVTIDLSNAYECDNLNSYIRKMDFDREKYTIEVSDKFVYNEVGEFDSAFVTYKLIEIKDNNTIIFKGDKADLRMEISGSEHTLCIAPIKSSVDENKESLHPIRISVKCNEKSGELKYVFSIADNN